METQRRELKELVKGTVERVKLKETVIEDTLKNWHLVAQHCLNNKETLTTERVTCCVSCFIYRIDSIYR